MKLNYILGLAGAAVPALAIGSSSVSSPSSGSASTKTSTSRSTSAYTGVICPSAAGTVYDSYDIRCGYSSVQDDGQAYHIETTTSSLEACAAICDNETFSDGSKCTAFTWAPDNNNYCNLKNSTKSVTTTSNVGLRALAIRQGTFSFPSSSAKAPSSSSTVQSSSFVSSTKAGSNIAGSSTTLSSSNVVLSSSSGQAASNTASSSKPSKPEERLTAFNTALSKTAKPEERSSSPAFSTALSKPSKPSKPEERSSSPAFNTKSSSSGFAVSSISNAGSSGAAPSESSEKKSTATPPASPTAIFSSNAATTPSSQARSTAAPTLSSSSSPPKTSSSTKPKPTIVQTSGLFTYIGCYKEGGSGFGRALTGKLIGSSDISVGHCAYWCRNYKYAGVEDGFQCFCGSTINSGAAPAAGNDAHTTGCNSPCKGNSTQYCGGGAHLNMYQNLHFSSNPSIASRSSVQAHATTLSKASKISSPSSSAPAAVVAVAANKKFGVAANAKSSSLASASSVSVANQCAVLDNKYAYYEAKIKTLLADNINVPAYLAGYAAAAEDARQALSCP